jgi:hypothetical protein
MCRKDAKEPTPSENKERLDGGMGEEIMMGRSRPLEEAKILSR